MAARVVDDTCYTANVLQGVGEEHQVHDSVHFVVLLQRHVENFGKGVEAVNLIVQLIGQIAAGEVAVHQRVGIFFGVETINAEVREQLLRHSLRKLLVLCQMLVRHENVAVHAF